ncbi:oligoendopeptidase F [Kordiimonas pumila]|uniref:Oligopeptidase F n=1 Tax=Kordiimonas pumila TaxID=2161677 RepID=A0ABV7D3Z1_9PROT|nr:oligoendopeptidase F [Kordiimonas pumila]
MNITLTSSPSSAKKMGLAVFLALTIANVPFINPVNAQEKNQKTWDLTELYPTIEAWNAARESIHQAIEKLARFKGHLGDSPPALLSALDEISAIQKSAARIFTYASLGADENLRLAEGQERLSMARAVLAKFNQTTAYMAPEILAIGRDKIESFVKAEAGLKKHAFNLRDTLRNAEHTLGTEAENILANAAEVTAGPQRIYSLLTTAGIPWPEITLTNGTHVTLDQATYSKYRATQNREDRKKVFDTFWSSWKTYEAPLGQTLDTLVKSHIFEARSRHYSSSLERAVSSGNIPVKVYKTLVSAANDNLASMHRYLKLRGRMMGIKDLQYYDTYPETTQLAREFTVEDAKALTLASLKPFGEKYLSLMQQGFTGNWMHLYPQSGKRSGAYMQGAAYDVHPYVLLNFNKGFEDVSTFSHEWGHAVHSLLSKENNPYETYGYTIFTAELASTTNEVLLQEYMLSKNLSDAERLYYIDRALESYRGTFFRQTMFAEFELKIHEMAEAGEPLSGAKMTTLYLDLLKKYHGHDQGVMTIDPAYAIEWAYIPHFYYNFYVYQYATSLSGGTLFAERMLAGDQSAKNDYLNVLKAGGSKYPYDMLKEAGVDLATPAPYNALIARMNRLMDEADIILTRMGK